MQANQELVFDALGDATRRAIYDRLRRGPAPVGAIAEGLPVSRPAVSQHLKVLREAGLVAEAREGTRRIYRLDPGGLAALRAFYEDFWTAAMRAFERAAGKEQP